MKLIIPMPVIVLSIGEAGPKLMMSADAGAARTLTASAAPARIERDFAVTTC